MKVYSVLLIVVFCLTTNIFPQVEFTPHTITTSADAAWSVYAVDVDGDGDIDVLSASGNDDKIAWYENDGNENFTSHTITTNTNCAGSVYVVDVDGDGDMDVLSASFCDDKIAWYENLLITGIVTNSNEIPSEYRLSQSYPNPFNPSTNIKYSVPENGFVKLSVYNLVGEEVIVLVNETVDAGFYEIEFDAAYLPSGIYFYRLQTSNFIQTKKMVLMK